MPLHPEKDRAPLPGSDFHTRMATSLPNGDICLITRDEAVAYKAETSCRNGMHAVFPFWNGEHMDEVDGRVTMLTRGQPDTTMGQGKLAFTVRPVRELAEQNRAPGKTGRLLCRIRRWFKIFPD